MTGIIDHSAARRPHTCHLPPIHRFGPPRGLGGLPTMVTDHPEGTRFHCDACPRVWVVWNEPPLRGPRVYLAGGLTWREETRRERRRRLGLTRWARARRTSGDEA